MPDAFLDGEERIFGVKMREHPAQVPAGFAAEAINQRFTDGVPEPRGGVVHLPWLNQTTVAGMTRFDVIYGVGRFKDANGLLWNLQAADGAVYACRPNNLPLSLALPSGVTITGEVTFEQLGGTVVMMRGPDLDPLEMSDVTVGFTEIDDPESGLGLSRIPRGRRAIAAADRLWVMTGADQLWASDVLDHTSYAVLNQFRFSDGSADDLVTVAVFGTANNDAMIIGLKELTVWSLDNISQADDDGVLVYTRARRITKRYGCVAAASVVDLGTDLQWWAQVGPASLTITIQNEVLAGQGVEQLLPGNDIAPLVRRVNQNYRSGIVAAFYDNKVYWAVPLDDAVALRDDLVNGAGAGTTHRLSLVSGATYRYTRVSAETSLTDGATTLTGSNDFVSSGEAQLNAAAPLTLSSRVQRCYKGVNNAVLVYDFAATPGGAWAGYDQAVGIEPKYFFFSPYLGKDRLCFAGADGWSCLYEEGWEDAHPTPYLDVVVGTLPAVGNTLRVNGGTTAVANATDHNAVATGWGCFTLAFARDNIWVDYDGLGGFYHSASNQWTSPEAVPVRITSGVRFYSLDGSIPTAVTTGSWATTTTTLWQGIETRLVSRGYTEDARLVRKRALQLALFLETYRPTYSIAVRSDGVFRDVTFISERTRSRTVYDRPQHAPEWDATNDDDDFGTPGRQDYSLVLDPNFALSGAETDPQVRLGLHQAVPHYLSVAGKARAHQVIVTNTAGRCRIVAAGIGGRAIDRGVGVRDS